MLTTPFTTLFPNYGQEINWMAKKATCTRQYPDSADYYFEGKIPYPMAMKAWKDAAFTRRSDWGIHHYYASSDNIGFDYNSKTGRARLTFLVAIEHHQFNPLIGYEVQS